MLYDIPLLAVSRRRESMMKRRELREHIFELLFRIEFNSSEEMPEQMQLFFDGLDELGEQDQSYMEEKYRRIVEKLPELDRRIEETAKSWRISRMGKVDLTILRLAVYEMEFDDDVPVGVAINEAVELSKKFGGDDSPAFVNGILGKIGKKE
jgi:N utilization substance protein B